MSNLTTKTATAALIATAIVTPTAVALNHTDNSKATADSKVKLYGDTMVRTELFFGTDKPGPDVTNWQFQQFVDKTVTPRFPDGLTVLDGNGQWKDSDSGKVIKERSKVIVILYSLDEETADSKKIEEIRDKYKKQYQQESVLRTDTTEQVSF
jgi:hypothetical protein